MAESQSNQFEFAPHPRNKRFIDLTGQRFNKLTVLGYAGKRGSHPAWYTSCDCGRVTTPLGINLKTDKVMSCGCLRGAPTGAGLEFIKEAVQSQTDECIIWPYHKVHGYGEVNLDGRDQRAHRVVLQMVTGENPKGMHACHAPEICHNRACVNPRHLRWGTPKENQHDMFLDGTISRGEKRWNSKLTEADVHAIRADPRINRVIAADYGVHRKTVCDIKNGRTWSWVQ